MIFVRQQCVTISKYESLPLFFSLIGGGAKFWYDVASGVRDAVGSGAAESVCSR